MTLVKICGITNLEDAFAAVAAGAGALGFNFYPPSPRYLTPAAARRIVEELPATILCVGVFVDEKTPAVLRRIAAVAGVAAVQLHGDESPEYCHTLKGYQVIKALRVGPDFAPEAALKFETEAILLDAYCPQAHGGTGRAFDWSLARRTRELVGQLYLAGGLTPENVAGAIASVKPTAVDVCSGIELAPGRKDHTRMSAFIASVRLASENS